MKQDKQTKNSACTFFINLQKAATKRLDIKSDLGHFSVKKLKTVKILYTDFPLYCGVNLRFVKKK